MKRMIFPCFLLTLVFLISLGLHTSYASTYETEPNNDQGDADPLTEGEPMIGQIYDPTVDVDWFKLLSVSAGEVIHGHIYGGTYTITVQNDAGDVLAIVSGNGTEAEPLEIFAGSGSAGNYYIIVEATHDAYYTLTVAASKQPSANAGVDQTVDQGETVILDGSESSDPDDPDDPDDGIVTYAWTQTHGTTVTLSSTSAIKPLFTAPNVGEDGESLIFELTVTDGTGLRDTDSVIITVTYLNQPPTADAGPDQTVNEGVSVALDGSGSTDPDDGIASYAWAQTHGTAVVLSSSSVVEPTFTSPSVDASGECLIFELTVTDAGGLIDTDEVFINVTSVNLPPTSDAGTDQAVMEGASVTLDGSGSSDPDDGIATYAWTQLSGTTVTLSNASAIQPIFTAPDVSVAGESLIFELTVTDVGGLKDTDRVTINVSYVNHPPTADAGADQTVNENVSVALNGSGSTDPDDGIVTYAWTQTHGTAVVLSSSSAIQPTFTSPSVGPEGECLIFELTVTDAGGLTDTDEVFINVTSVNLPPTAAAGTDQTVGEGASVTLDGSSSSDPDDGIATYAWTQLSGTTVTLSDASAVQPAFTAPNVSAAGESLIFELTVTDVAGLKDTDRVIITVTYLNQPPTADAGSDQTVGEDVSVALDGSGSTDPDDGIVTYVWTQTNGTAVVLSSSSVVQPTFTSPTVDATGECLIFELTVTDAGGLTDTDEVFINVTTVNQPPTADAGTDQDVVEGASVMLDGSRSTDPDDGIASYAWTQLSGKSVTLTNPTESEPLFTAPDVGAEGEALIFELTVTDVGGLKDTDRVTVNVSFVNQPPAADAGPDQTVNENVSVALDGSGSTDPDDGIVTYAWTQTNGTAVVLSSSSAIQPTFTSPSVDATGECLIFDLTVTDAGGLTDTDQVFINVTSVNLPPSADAGIDQTVGEDANVALDGSGSSDPDDGIATYAWTQLTGTTVTLSDASAIQPIFTAPDVGVAGESLIFELTVTDVGGLKDTDRVTINVTFVNQPPTSDAGPDQTVDEDVSVALDGSGSTDPDDGIATYKWTQTHGTAVVLSSSSAVRPTFTSPEDVGPTGECLIFELTVTDAGGLIDTDEVFINVTSFNQPPTADAGTDQTAGEGATVTLDGSGSSDPDDGIATYEWTQLSGTTVTLSNPSAVQPIFTAPDVGVAGESLIFELAVKDVGGLKDTDRVTIDVGFENQPPTADAGPDQTVNENVSVALHGSGSTDPDDGIAFYEWTQISGTSVVLSSDNTVNPTFISPDVGVNGESMIFQLTVKDHYDLPDSDRVTITVNWVNDPPTADAGTDQDVAQGALVTLDGSGSTDPDDDIASYAWTQLSGVSAELSDLSAVKPTFIAPNVGPAEDPIIFLLTVTDNGGLSDYATVQINVTWENEPPVADAGLDQKVDEGTLVTLDGSGSTDPDDGIASYEWTQLSGTAVILSDASAEAPTFTAPNVDPYGELLTFELTVTDNGGLTSTDTCSVRILGTPGAVYVPEEYPTIQEGIDAVSEGGTVFVADGTYTGTGNRNLDFKGKAFTLKSQNGPDTCTINYSGVNRGFCFDTGEETDSILDGFTITNGNEAGGGAGILCSYSSPTIINCVITANRTSWEGGGISCYFASPVIVNCVISENSAGQSGGGILCYYASPVITNCTISENSADRGGAISCFASFPTITNCILWGNSPDEINNNDPDVTYSDIEGGYDGEGNINTDPLFAGNGDYQLTSSSPCLDSGTSVGAPSTDIEGTSRPQGAGYDMGAYEFISATPMQGGLPWIQLLLLSD